MQGTNEVFEMDMDGTWGEKKTKQEAKQGDAANKLRDSSNTARSPDPLRQKGLGPSFPIIDPSHSQYEECLEGRKQLYDLLATVECQECIPESGKIVIIDTRIKVRQGFAALMENEVRCAPLWDSATKTFSGMLTITDFVNILRGVYPQRDDPAALKQLEEKTIAKCPEVATKMYSKLLTIGPQQSLLDAAAILVKHKIHRVPIVDPANNSILHILTHARILCQLISMLPTPHPLLLSKSVAELRIGTYERILTMPTGTSLIKIFDIMAKTGYSAIPIVDEAGALVDIYSKGDVPSLAFHRTYPLLDRPVEQVINESRSSRKLVHTCSLRDSLFSVIDRLLTHRTHRLFCVDSNNHIEGIVSMLDVLEFLLKAREGTL